MVGRGAHDVPSGPQLESGNSDLSGLSVAYDTPWAGSATTDATVTRDWLGEWLATTHDPSQQPSQRRDGYGSPSHHPVAVWIPFYAGPAPRYLENSSILWRIVQVSCLSSCLLDGPHSAFVLAARCDAASEWPDNVFLDQFRAFPCPPAANFSHRLQVSLQGSPGHANAQVSRKH